MKRPRLLYGYQVCQKCYYKFTNRRQLAFFIDIVVFNMIVLVLAVALGALIIALDVETAEDNAVSTLLIELVFGLGLPLLFLAKDGFNGKSPGKAICGITVIKRGSGARAGFVDSILRNLPMLIPFAPLIIALTLSPGYRLGDGWAQTKVIWDKYAHDPAFSPVDRTD